LAAGRSNDATGREGGAKRNDESNALSSAPIPSSPGFSEYRSISYTRPLIGT
jgi:hypothetical protein